MQRSLYLASQSPRRLELLRQIGITPVVLTLRTNPPRRDVDEAPLPGEKALDYVQRLARMKVEAACLALAGRSLPQLPIIAADTAVTIDGEILGKPGDAAEAKAMLHGYSGRVHTVLTAVAAAYHEHRGLVVSESEVRFKTLSEAEIAAYVSSREPFDKAGGYAIQGRAAIFIEHLAGSYSGVMGLPLFETTALLREAGFEVL